MPTFPSKHVGPYSRSSRLADQRATPEQVCTGKHCADHAPVKLRRVS